MSTKARDAAWEAFRYSPAYVGHADESHAITCFEAGWRAALEANSPSDTEQLIRLREACQAALLALDQATFHELDATGDRARRLLREALQVKAEMKGEQL